VNEVNLSKELVISDLDDGVPLRVVAEQLDLPMHSMAGCARRGRVCRAHKKGRKSKLVKLKRVYEQSTSLTELINSKLD